MFSGAKIIAVDDELEELEKIVSSLRELGLACIAYNYPDELPDETPISSGLRVLFLDINLIGGASPGQDASVLNAPISLIERLISDNNGPYALITWSSTELHDSLIARISKTASLANRQPFYSQALSKEEYSNSPTRLKEAVEKIFKENAPFGALLDWEKRVCQAGETVLQDIGKLALEFEGGNASEKMDRMLSKLAVDAFGKVHVEAHLFESVNEALLPLLSDALSVQFNLESGEDIWKAAVTKHSSKNQLNQKAVSKLNTAVIFEQSSECKAYRRGAIVELPVSWSSEDEFAKRFGASPAQIRGGLLKLETPKKPKWVLVQTQAACDFAQNTVGPLPFLLAAIVPDNHKRKTSSDGNPLRLPSSVWSTPQLICDEIVKGRSFSFEIIHGIPCHITRKVLDELECKVLGRLKDQIVASLSFEHHSHGSRPGFVSFR